MGGEDERKGGFEVRVLGEGGIINDCTQSLAAEICSVCYSIQNLTGAVLCVILFRISQGAVLCVILFRISQGAVLCVILFRISQGGSTCVSHYVGRFMACGK